MDFLRMQEGPWTRFAFRPGGFGLRGRDVERVIVCRLTAAASRGRWEVLYLPASPDAAVFEKRVQSGAFRLGCASGPAVRSRVSGQRKSRSQIKLFGLGSGLGVLLGSFGSLDGRRVWIRGRSSSAKKGVWRMPWRQEAMKDVARCEKPWGAASRL